MNKYAQNIMDAVMDWLQDDEEETVQTILYLYKTTTDTALKSTIFDILTDCDRRIDTRFPSLRRHRFILYR